MGAASLIFSAPMIVALSRGEKTVTRRVLRYPASVLRKHGKHWAEWLQSGGSDASEWGRVAGGWEPRGDAGMQNGALAAVGPLIPERFSPGDCAWVKEAWTSGFRGNADDGPLGVIYRADRTFRETCPRPTAPHHDAELVAIAGLEPKWRTPLFMPRWASRFELEIVDVRVERLHDITEDDCIAEGITRKLASAVPRRFTYWIEGQEFADARTAYSFAWAGINEDTAPWESNPWVRRLEFKVVTA